MNSHVLAAGTWDARALEAAFLALFDEYPEFEQMARHVTQRPYPAETIDGGNKPVVALQLTRA